MMTIQLSGHFTYKKILLFTLPSIVMMIFTSLFGVVDGFFVSNFVGKPPFAAVNFIMPVLMVLGSIGFMFGTGGSALVAKTLGEERNDKAKEIFSLLIYVSLILGVIIAVLGIIFIPSIAALLGAKGEMLEGAVVYGRLILMALPAYMLQQEFQSFFATAQKPQLGLGFSLTAGITNIILDALFVVVFQWGLVGAAVATATSQVVGGCFPLVYFSRRNTSLLQLTKTHFDGSVLLKTCTNGSSELMSNISMSLVSILYNVQLMKYAGENGIAAYGVLMYVNMIFLATFIGYSIGTAPVVGYHYGANHHDELKSLLKKSFVLIGIASICMLALGQILALPLSTIFVGYDVQLMQLTLHGFKIYSFTFLFAGTAIYGSAFFTALNDGLTSALISFLRTLVFQVVAILILPLIWSVDGIWYSTVIAEMMALIVTVLFLMKKRSKYHY